MLCASLTGMWANRASAPRGTGDDASCVAGSVCWVQVSSIDPAGSREFYSGLFDWVYQIDTPTGRGKNVTAWCGGRPVAGLAAVPARADQATWTLYLATPNVIRTAQALCGWGGRVLNGPVEVPGRGRMVVCVDPTGALIGFSQPARRQMLSKIGPGSMYWAQLDTWDGARADAFYADLLGYQQYQIGDGSNVDYTIWSRDGQPMLGRLQMTCDWADRDEGAQWILHFVVDPQVGTDATVDRVLAFGGWAESDPYDTEFGRTARVADPSGAAFALIDPTDRVDPDADLAPGLARVDDPYDD